MEGKRETENDRGPLIKPEPTGSLCGKEHVET